MIYGELEIPRMNVSLSDKNIFQDINTEALGLFVHFKYSASACETY